MTSRISYNIHAQFVTDTPRLLTHLQKIQPAAVLVMDGLSLARGIKAMLPNTIVINRIYPDEDIQNHKSPEDWHKERAEQAAGGIYQYTSNEAGFSPKLIEWHIRLMELCIKSRTPLVIGNMSVGTPEATDWADGRRLLELLDQHRDLFILGLHEYACAVITSGFLGGYPDNAGVAPNSGQKGRNLIQPESWPSKAEAADMTMFHCGRFKFLINYCKSIGIKPPRIILTEHGFDDVSDIKPWMLSLAMTPPYTTIRGWKSAQNQWRRWYEARGWSPQRAMFEQLTYADRTIYQKSPVEAQLIYCWAGREDYKWDQFDMSKAGEFQEWLETYATQTPQQQPPVTYPKPPAANDPRWKQQLTETAGSVNVRKEPHINAAILEQIVYLEIVSTIAAESHGDWMPVKNQDGVIGWVNTSVVTFKDMPIDPPADPDLITISREEALVLAGKYHTAALATMEAAKELQSQADFWTEIANR